MQAFISTLLAWHMELRADDEMGLSKTATGVFRIIIRFELCKFNLQKLELTHIPLLPGTLVIQQNMEPCK